jgi:hypothetical protein
MDILIGLAAAAFAILAFWTFSAFMEWLDLFIATTREKRHRLKPRP